MIRHCVGLKGAVTGTWRLRDATSFPPSPVTTSCNRLLLCMTSPSEVYGSVAELYVIIFGA
jgi:hypothetical protein